MEICIRRQKAVLQVFFCKAVLSREERQDTVAGSIREAFRCREDLYAGTPIHVVVAFAEIREEEKHLPFELLLDFPLRFYLSLHCKGMIDAFEIIHVGGIELGIGIFLREVGDAAGMADDAAVREIDHLMGFGLTHVFALFGKAGQYPVLIRSFFVFHDYSSFMVASVVFSPCSTMTIGRSFFWMSFCIKKISPDGMTAGSTRISWISFCLR